MRAIKRTEKSGRNVRVSSPRRVMRNVFLLGFIVLALRGTAAADPPLNAPSSLTAVAVSSTQINLNWVDTNTRETGYSIERSLNATTGFVEIATTAADATTYQNTGLTASTLYYYQVRAFGQKYSPYSNVASTTTLANTPTPTNTATATKTVTPTNTATPSNTATRTA